MHATYKQTTQCLCILHTNNIPQTPCVHVHTETMREYFPSNSLHSNNRKHTSLLRSFDCREWLLHGSYLISSYALYLYLCHTCIIQAVENNDKISAQQWLRWLGQNPAEVSILSDKDVSGNTAAHLAAKLNRDEILKMMFSSKLGGWYLIRHFHGWY